LDKTRNKKLTTAVTTVVVAVSIILLILYALKYNTGYALLSAVLVTMFIVPFFLSLEMRKPKARDIVPIAVMAALGVVGRIAFAAVAGVKPTTAVVIISGIAFGPQAGFLTGAVSALASNFFFGQGAWTPWQMLAWGLCGLLAGMFKNIGAIKGTKTLIAFGFFVSILFGLIMNCWHIIGFVNPITWGAVIATLTASLYYDLAHAVSTAIFLLLLGNVWLKKLERIKTKFGVMQAPIQEI
jgi:energy-coupling factor transport system substrate-specific component